MLKLNCIYMFGQQSLLQNILNFSVVIRMYNAIDTSMDKVDRMESQMSGNIIGRIKNGAISCDYQQKAIKRLQYKNIKSKHGKYNGALLIKRWILQAVSQTLVTKVRRRWYICWSLFCPFLLSLPLLVTSHESLKKQEKQKMSNKNDTVVILGDIAGSYR